MSHLLTGTPARIYMWTGQRLEFEGADVQLFCRADGSPSTTIKWLDQRGNVITNEQKQYSVNIHFYFSTKCSELFRFFNISCTPVPSFPPKNNGFFFSLSVWDRKSLSFLETICLTFISVKSSPFNVCTQIHAVTVEANPWEMPLWKRPNVKR